ncbi:PKD domain-containing protein [Desulfobacterales bacterium HSG16]|nr:PKD domain-containing protein [Desulfobacterales bacterium HSG16]
MGKLKSWFCFNLIALLMLGLGITVSVTTAEAQVAVSLTTANPDQNTGPISIKIHLESLDKLPSLACYVHYDSTKLTYVGFSDKEAATGLGTLDPADLPENIIMSDDGDPKTDRFVSIPWDEPAVPPPPFTYTWPDNLPTDLVTLNFTLIQKDSYVRIRSADANTETDLGLSIAGPVATGVTVAPNSDLEGLASVALGANLDDAADRNIKAAEYFIDTDPGEGLGKPIGAGNVAPGYDNDPVVVSAVTVDTSALTAGTYKIYIRGQDADDSWGTPVAATLTLNLNQGPVATVVTVLPNPTIQGQTPVTLTATLTDPEAHNVADAEYYINIDPGEGLGTSIAAANVAPDYGNNPVNVTVADVVTAALGVGTHKIYVRGKDDKGKWGTAVSADLVVNVNEGPAATVVTVTPNPTVEGQSPVTLTATLTDPEGHDVANAEYYINTDPGVGLGTGIAAANVAPGYNNNPVNVNVTDVDTTALTAGTHKIYIRGKDSLGIWGTSVSADLVVNVNEGPAATGVTVLPNPTVEGQSPVTLTATLTDPEGHDVTAAEYYIDTDPGDGLAFTIAASVPPYPDNPVAITVANVDTSALDAGTHKIYVRGKDEYNKWGTPVSADLTVNPCDAQADYSYAPAGGAAVVEVGFPVQFTNATTGAAAATATWDWNFGDATAIDNTESPLHTYAAEAIGVEVELKATGTAGCFTTYKEPAFDVVCDYRPGFTTDKTVDANDTITIVVEDSITYTEDGSEGSGAAANYAWAFPGGNRTVETTQGPHTIQYMTDNDYPDTKLTTTSANSCNSSATALTIKVLPCDAQAAFTADNRVVTRGTEIIFSNSSYGSLEGDAPYASAIYDWNLDGDAIYEETDNPGPITFNTSQLVGEKIVSLLATGSTGCQTTAPMKVYVNDPDCVVRASIGADKTDAKVAETINFTSDETAGAVDGWLWDFGDGTSPDTSQNPTHNYATPGEYIVILKATDSAAGPCSWYAEKTITVTCDVTANFTATTPLTLPNTTVSFTNTTTGGTNFDWDFDGDGTIDDTTTDPTTNPDAFQYPAVASTYTAKMTATSANGCTTIKTVPITIAAVPVNPTPNPPPSIPPATRLPTVKFSTDPEPLEDETFITGYAPFEVEFKNESTDYYASEWDFGDIDDDDTDDDKSDKSTDRDPTYTYETAGTYTVTLKVTGVGGSNTKIEKKYVIVKDYTASFTVEPASGSAPLEVSLKDTTTDPVDTWAWVITDSVGAEVATSQTQNFNYEFQNQGVYTITLTASEPEPGKGTATISKDVTVTEKCVIGANISSPSQPIVVGDEVTFADSSTGDITTWLWDFGGGVTSSEQNAKHTFNAMGSMAVTLTVTNDGTGCTDTTTISVEVIDGSSVDAPVASFTASPVSGVFPLAVSFSSGASTGVINSWSWSFGDSGVSTDANPAYTYNSEGIYSVSLVVTGPGGSNTKTLSNLITVTDPNALDPPTPSSPADGAIDQPLPLVLKVDDSGSGYSYQWQLATDTEFTVLSLVYDKKTSEPSFTVPALFLKDQSTMYFWRVRVIDAQGNESPWSQAFRFSTIAVDTNDAGGNGVNDDNELDDTDASLDLDNNGVFDKDQTNTDPMSLFIKTAGNVIIGVVGTQNVQALTRLMLLDSADVPSGSDGIGSESGFFGFRALAAQPGDDATFVAYVSPVPENGARLYYYNNLTGDFDIAGDAAGAEGITFTVKDGSAWDADGLENGVVIVSAAGMNLCTGFTVTQSDLKVTVNALSSAGTTADMDYAWTFGDDTTAEGVTASHTYSAAGTYIITLMVEGLGGCGMTIAKTITVTAGSTGDSGSSDNCFISTAANGMSMMPLFAIMLAAVIAGFSSRKRKK